MGERDCTEILEARFPKEVRASLGSRVRISEGFTCAQCREERTWGRFARLPDETLKVVCLKCANLLIETGFSKADEHEEER